MFLVNSCLSHFSAAARAAPLLPKLRGHFAEFLDNASPAGLRILSSSTCVGLRYGYVRNDSGFSRHRSEMLPYLFSVHVTPCRHASGFANLPDLTFVPVSSFPAHLFPMRPHSSVRTQYRNLHLLSIGYGFRPHLRSRLTQGRSALPWKPWIFGRKDSHLTLATHSGILSSIKSTALFSTASSLIQCSSTDHLRDP